MDSLGTPVTEALTSRTCAVTGCEGDTKPTRPISDKTVITFLIVLLFVLQSYSITMHKIVVAITGASGSIYASLLLQKLLAIRQQWQELSVVITNNAKLVWKTELGSENYQDLDVS